MGEYFIPIEETTPTVTFLFKNHLPHQSPDHCSTRMHMFGKMITFHPKTKTKRAIIEFELKTISGLATRRATTGQLQARWAESLGTLILNMAEYAAKRGAEIEVIKVKGIHVPKKPVYG